ncbi:LOW QUALITY PROTEIN: hypothetical protein V2J09_008463 [Rumex salicifolius]
MHANNNNNILHLLGINRMKRPSLRNRLDLRTSVHRLRMWDPKRGSIGIMGPIVVGVIVAANILAGAAFEGASMNPALSFRPTVKSEEAAGPPILLQVRLAGGHAIKRWSRLFSSVPQSVQAAELQMWRRNLSWLVRIPPFHHQPNEETNPLRDSNPPNSLVKVIVVLGGPDIPIDESISRSSRVLAISGMTPSDLVHSGRVNEDGLGRQL